MAHSSSYTDVFLSQSDLPNPPFQKIDQDARLSRFHTKYWNESIDQDESKWVQAHTKLTHTELTDTDESEVVRGCFRLDLGHHFDSKLWVRKDYIRIYDYCVNRYEHVRNKLRKAPSVVITGQPGLGECFSWTFRFQSHLYEKENLIGSLMLYGEAKPFLWYLEQR